MKPKESFHGWEMVTKESPTIVDLMGTRYVAQMAETKDPCQKDGSAISSRNQVCT